MGGFDNMRVSIVLQNNDALQFVTFNGESTM